MPTRGRKQRGKRQRFYARNALNTTLLWGAVALMSPFSADPFRPASATPVDPALTSFTDEVCAALARLFAYVGTLALIGILIVRGCDQLLIMLADPPTPDPSWIMADRPRPASSVTQADSIDKTDTYSTLRHRLAGRRNVLRLAGGASTHPKDWITTPESPHLRGTL
jgi:hypothetical protein